MNILVVIRKVASPNSAIVIEANSSQLNLSQATWIFNPFDEIALEEAIRMKERGQATSVVALAVGPRDMKKHLQYAVGMGADRGIHVVSEDTVSSSLMSRIVTDVFQRGDYALIITGALVIDTQERELAPFISELLRIPLASNVFEVNHDGEHLLVKRQMAGSYEIVRLPLPCVISAGLRLNEPRYPSMKNYAKARRYSPENIDINEIALCVDDLVTTTAYRYSDAKRCVTNTCGPNELASILARMLDEG